MSSEPTWRIEPQPKPTEGHAADAVEMVEGEPVRRVSLPKFDCEVLKAHAAVKQEKDREPYAEELATHMKVPVSEADAALKRLALIGLIKANPHRSTLQ